MKITKSLLSTGPTVREQREAMERRVAEFDAKEKTSNPLIIKEGEESSFPVSIMAQSFGNWSLGFAWVNVALGGAQTTGLALYARHRAEMAKRRIVASFKDGTEFLLAKCKVPGRAAGKLMAKAMSEGAFDERKAAHTPGPWRVAEHRPAGLLKVETGDRVICDGFAGERGNASLIAAAPDLLRVAQIADNLGGIAFEDCAGYRACVNELVEFARKAIDKATA